MRNQFIYIVVALLFLASCSSNNTQCPALYLDICYIDDDRVELIKASRDGDMETVKKLLNKKENVEAINATVFSLGNYNALSAASENGRIEIVQFLLDKGAKADKDAVEHASKGGYIKIVKLFVEEEGVVVEGDLGQEALRLAEENGHEEIVDFLRKAGAE